MFHSFFPNPRLFFLSFAAWGTACVVVWFALASGGGPWLGLGGLLGYPYPEALPPDADEAAQAAFAVATDDAETVWFYQYTLLAYVLFVVYWLVKDPHPWRVWSVVGTAIIVFSTWFQVQIDVWINEWFGSFYDLIQAALAEPGAVTLGEYYGQLLTFFYLAGVWIMLAIALRFFTSHYVFRWRTAMNNYYVSVWGRVRHIEGASQRVQEDTMRFARITEALGSDFLDAVMTLIAFLPILWVLSSNVTEIPVFGAIPGSLVWIAIIWSIVGTFILAAAGIKLPGLEFRNQRVEAAYRKELVIGEDNPDRAAAPRLNELFGDVRTNYFRLFFHYCYFNLVRFSYLQASVLVAYVALAPSIVAAGITLGVMQQIVRAFGRVQESFQFLVRSWPTIIELMSIYKRLAAFEAVIEGRELSDIEFEVIHGHTRPA